MVIRWCVLGFLPLLSVSSATYLFPQLDISLPHVKSDGACGRDSLLLGEALRNQSLWAMQMQDATAQGTTGALFGNMYQMGNFDECFRVQHPIKSKYCLVDIKAGTPDNPEHHEVWNLLQISRHSSYLSRELLHTAVCVPSSCDNGLLQEAFQNQIDSQDHPKDVKYKVHVPSELCTESIEHEPFYVGEIAFWCVVGLLILVNLLGTLFTHSKSDNRLAEAFRCFSITENFQRLKEVGQEDVTNPMAPLHGVKVLSIVIVFFGHRVGLPSGFGVFNYQHIEELRHTGHNMFMMQADLVVDTFFFISGVLTIYYMLHVLSKGSLNPLQALIARLIRIAPTYYLLVWFQASAAKRLGSGPMWNFIQGAEESNCVNYWWANILFINNFLPASKICHVHSWYLPCDLHFFLIAMLLSNILARKPMLGKAALVFLVLLTPIIPAYIVYANSLDPIIMFYDAFMSNPRSSAVFDLLYKPSHVRVTVYLIGIAMGYILHKQNASKHVISKGVAFCGGVLGLSLLLIPMTVGGLYYSDQPPGMTVSIIYAAVRRPIWALGLAVFLLVHRFRPKNIVSKVLSSAPAIILSRLTLTFYLVHFVLILCNAAKRRTSETFFFYDFMVKGSGEMLTACTYSAIIYVFLELPIRRLFREVVFAKALPKVERSNKTNPPQGVFTVQL